MRKLLLPALLLFFGLPAPLLPAADLFSPPRPLYSIRTEHFTIIFPEESRSAAERLASFAEEEYADVAGLLREPMHLHIPVVISPDSQVLNGGYAFMTPSIYLFQAPISPADGWASYADDLRKIFRHELTHAVSMMTRGGFWDFLAFLFCDGLSPAWGAPNSFIEGVTISFESLDGFGRAAQTPYASVIQQDIIEGKLKDFPQAAGSWSGWPGGIWYDYGAWFSRWLQETYGMDRYAAWWKRLSKAENFHSYGALKGSFEKTFGLSVEEAWAGFASWIAIRKPVVAAVEPVDDGFRSVNAMAAGAGRLFWADELAVWEWSPGGGPRPIFPADGLVNRLSLSPDGRELLVSWARYVDGLPRLALKSWDLEEGRWLDRPWPAKLQEAAWLPDGSGIAASRIAGYTQDLVEIRDGETRVLFKGTEALVPGNPCPLADGSLAFLLKVEGEVMVARLDADGQVSVLESDAFSIPHASRTTTANIRNLSASGTELAFCWDTDLSLHKLARLGADGLSVQATSLSGGIQYPVALDGSLYYAGTFSDGQRVCRYPASNPDLRLEAFESSWRPLPAELLSKPSVYDAPPSMEAKRWSPFPRLLVPQVRLPLLALNPFAGEDSSIMVAGAGLHGESIDPTQANMLLWEALWRWNDAFADASLAYSYQGLPVTIGLSASDALYPAASDGSLLLRQTVASLSLGQTTNLMPARRALSWGAQTALVLGAFGPAASGVAQGSPYSWAYGDPAMALAFSLLWSDMAGSVFQPQGPRGWELGASYGGWLEPLAWAPPLSVLGVHAAGALPVMNLRADLWGAWCPVAGLVVGPAGASLSDGTPFPYSPSPSWAAYAVDAGLAGSWYAFGQISSGWRFRTDAGFKWLGTYVEDFTFLAGYRAGVSEAASSFRQSAWMRAYLGIGAYDAGPLQGATVDVGLELDLRLSDMAPVILPYLSVGL